MERQELVLVGLLALQQQLPGAAQRQGAAGGGLPAAAAAGRAAGLRQQRAVLLGRHERAAPAHLPRLLPAARGAHLHDLEQIAHAAVGPAGARLCGLPGAAGGPVSPAGVALRLVHHEGLPLREESGGGTFGVGKRG